MDASTVVLPSSASALPHVRSPHRLLMASSQSQSQFRQPGGSPSRPRRTSQSPFQRYEDRSPRPGLRREDLATMCDTASTVTTTLDAHTLHAWSATSSVTGALGSAASSQNSFELKRESSEERDRTRCDSSLTGGDARLSICSTSGTVYESVVVVGHIYGSDNVVYYLLEVKSWESPLEGYVIRRRYNDFKQLHRELELCMPQTGGVRRGTTDAPTRSGHGRPPVHKPRRSSLPFGIYSSSLLCTGLASAQPETSPLWSPTRPAPPSHRRSSITGFHLHGVDESLHDPPRSAPLAPPLGPPLPPPSSSSQSGRPQWSTNHGFVDLPFDHVWFNHEGRPVLPPMPPGGVSSFFSSREMLIKYRIEKFNRLLAAVLSDTSAAVAQLLMNFIQDKPSAPQSYVSLNQYAPVEMPWSVERYARRRATMSGKREKALQAPLASAG